MRQIQGIQINPEALDYQKKVAGIN